MKIIDLPNGWFLRLDPGDEFIASLKQLADIKDISFAEISSGVGMIENARLGFFCIPKDDYDVFDINEGPYDLSSVSGNISKFNGQKWPHLHVVTNKLGGQTYSGHVLSAICYITAEIFILDYSILSVVRRKRENIPASRLEND